MLNANNQVNTALAELSEKLLFISENFNNGDASVADLLSLKQCLLSITNDKPVVSENLSHLNLLSSYAERFSSGAVTHQDINSLRELISLISLNNKTLQQPTSETDYA